MAYYPDLSPYEYLARHESGNVLNVGWLDVAYPYPKGEVPDIFVERLWAFCRISVMRTRGFYVCELGHRTDMAQYVQTAQRGDEKQFLGSAEIRVFGSGGQLYAAPNLIYHYVVDHHYRPPDVFIEAVLNGPLPGSPEYDALASEHEWYSEYKEWLAKS